MSEWTSFDYAILRLVPCVYRHTSFGLGVIVHAPSERFIGGRFVEDLSWVEPYAGRVDLDRVARYLDSLQRVVDGTHDALAELSPSERFHWLIAPRSDVLQPSPAHSGRCRKIACIVDDLFEMALCHP